MRGFVRVATENLLEAQLGWSVPIAIPAGLFCFLRLHIYLSPYKQLPLSLSSSCLLVFFVFATIFQLFRPVIITIIIR